MRTRFLLLVLFSMLVFLVSGYFVAGAMAAGAERDAAESSLTSLRAIAAVIDESTRTVEYAFTPLLGDSVFLSKVTDLGFLGPVRTYKDYESMKALEAVFRGTFLGNRDISFLHYLDRKSGLFLEANTYLRQVDPDLARTSGWYPNYLATDGDSPWTLNTVAGPSEPLLTCYRAVRDPEGSGSVIGVLSLSIRGSSVASSVGRLAGATARMVVVDALNHPVASVRGPSAADLALLMAPPRLNQETGFVHLSTGDALVVVHRSEQTGFRYVRIVPRQEFAAYLPRVTTYVAYSYVALLLAVTMLAASSYFSFYRPLRALSEGMTAVADGNFDLRLPTEGRSETARTLTAFNTMAAQLKRLIEDNYLIKLEQKDARMKMVLSQMNEHFLYNSLDSVHWLARKHGVDEIADIVFSLARFYSLSLSDGREVISVGAVAEVIENYLKILLIRKPENFSFTCEVEDAARPLPVLKFLFQPLVENAFVHGIADLLRPGRIDVAFQVDRDTLRFHVADNGTGMSPARLNLVRACLSAEGGEGEGFALRSVAAQIRLFYGDDGRITVQSKPDRGTRVEVVLPLSRLGETRA